MPKSSLSSYTTLIEALTKWREQAYLRFFHVKKISDQEHSKFLTGTKRLIQQGLKNGSLSIIEVKGDPVAVLVRRKAPRPRIKNQQEIVFNVKRGSLNFIQRPLKSAISKTANKAPKFTEIVILPEYEKLLAPTLKKAGFTLRYEILLGRTSKALNKLIRTKRPPKDLKHLGLKLRALKSEGDLKKALKLQKYVATTAKAHSYFAHTPAQLRKDKKEYKSIIKEDRGLVLGVFKGSLLLGLMVVGVHDGNGPEKHGDFSFFLHESIQVLLIFFTWLIVAIAPAFKYA